MRSKSRSEFYDRCEIPIVRNLSAGDPPYPFYWIELGGIGWQKDKSEPLLVLNEKLFQTSCPVIFGIVQNKEQFSLSRLEKVTQKVAEGLAIESGGFSGDKTSCFQVECTEKTHFLAGRCRRDLRLLASGGPHPYQAAVTLEMDFVLAPELDIGAFHPLVEVFLKASCCRGSAS